MKIITLALLLLGTAVGAASAQTTAEFPTRPVKLLVPFAAGGPTDVVDSLYQKHVRTVEQVGGINSDEFATLNKSLQRLERFWTDQILYRL